MSIKVRVYEGSNSSTRTPACFGFLAGNSHEGITALGWYPTCGGVDFTLSLASIGEAGDQYSLIMLKEIENIVNEVPIYKDFEIISPTNSPNFREQDFEVKAPTTLAADHIILGMFFLRNFSQYPQMQATYCWLRANSDLSRAACLVTMMTFCRKSSLSSFETESYRWSRTSGQIEASNIHQTTFGKLSFNAFAKQTESYKPWLQGPMCETFGYKRDSQYGRNETITTNLSRNLTELSPTPVVYRRIMASALTISEIEAPLHEVISESWTASDEIFLQVMSEILDERIGISDELREAIRWESLTPAQRNLELISNPTFSDGTFRESVQVVMSDSGKSTYVDGITNPHNSIGFVTVNHTHGDSTEDYTTEFIYQVTWEESNVSNSYRAADLELAPTKD